MSDPQWTNYQPPDPESERERTLTATAPAHPDNAFTFRSYAAAVIVGGLIAVAAIWYANVADGDERDAEPADPVDTSALEGDVLANALAEAGEIEGDDPFRLMVAENLLTATYFDAEGGQRRELWVDLDDTADHRTRTAPEGDPDFDPGTFPLAEVDADVLSDLTERAIAEAEHPTGFSITVDVPRQGDTAEIEVMVSDPEDTVWLRADLDGSDVSIE